MTERCADRSAAAGEPLRATAPTVSSWLLVEVPGSWPRDVSGGVGLPDAARERVVAWLAREEDRRRLLFVRRPGRPAASRSVFVIRADEGEAEVRRIELGTPDDLVRVELETAGAREDRSLVLVCGHGARDRCCALRGTAVYSALEPHLDPGDLWLSSHQGGHRFAANVLVLPSALQFGRLGPGDAGDVVSRALAGRIALDRYRGRTCYAPAMQAAEHAVRTAARLDRIDTLRAERLEGSVAYLRGADGAGYRAATEEVAGPILPASCGAEPVPQRTWVARVL